MIDDYTVIFLCIFLGVWIAFLVSVYLGTKGLWMSSNIYWLRKGHSLGCSCENCFEKASVNADLEAIKERLKHYYFATRQQEEDFISLMIMVEKLKR